MARIGRLNVLGVFAAGVLLLGSCSHAHGDAAAPAVKPDQEAVAKWLDRAEKYAASLPETQLAEVLATLCEPMVAAGKDENLNRLVATVKDKERRYQQEVLICSALALAGKYDAAIRRRIVAHGTKKDTVSRLKPPQWLPNDTIPTPSAASPM